MNIAKHLDLAVLNPLAKVSEIKSACELATWKGIKSICVAPVYTQLASTLFHNVSTVIGFPHGNTDPMTKITEAETAIKNGTSELDVVINYGRFLDGSEDEIKHELRGIVFTANKKVLVKTILETCYYSENNLRHVCKLCMDCGVDMLKTSTGFSGMGASPDVVKIMLRYGPVKASGGIKSRHTAELYLDLGCSRIGTSEYWGICE